MNKEELRSLLTPCIYKYNHDPNLNPSTGWDVTESQVINTLVNILARSNFKQATVQNRQECYEQHTRHQNMERS